MRRSSVIVGMLLVALVVAAAIGFAAYRSGQDDDAAAAGGGGGGDGGGFEPAEAVQVVAAREVSWHETADLVGTVVAMRSVVVRNELAAVVREVGFQSGSVVEQGQVLLRQDDTTEKADLEAARASVRVAEANAAQAASQVRLAEVELERLRSVQSRAVAEVDLDRARSRLDAATADRDRWGAEVDQARARVAQVEARLAKLTIRAPFRARTGMRTIHEGQYLAEGSDVVALQELTDRIYLDFAIPQQYAPRVTPGTAVMATGELLGPEPVRIEVVSVDATVNYDTRNLRVRAVVDNPRGTLVPGMFIQVRVPLEEPRTRVVVPANAVRHAAYGQSVFVVGPGEGGLRASQRFVKLGETVGDDIIVAEGLKAGERIAAAGSFKLRDGAKVMEGPPPGGPPGAPPAPGNAGADPAAPGATSATGEGGASAAR